MSLYVLQLHMLLVHLLLLCLYSLALHLLIGRILADEGKSAIHLGKILGTEDEHQLVLYSMMTAHIAHGTDILVLSVLQLLLKGFQLRLQDTDISVDMMNILLDAINLLLTLVYLTVQYHQVFQSLLHIRLIPAERLFLLLDFLLDRRTLSLQSSDRSIAVGSHLAFCPGRGSLPYRSFFSVLRLGSHCGLSHWSLLLHLFLGIGSQREYQSHH